MGSLTGPYLEGDPNDIIPDEQLPFTRFKLPPEEEDSDSIRTGNYHRTFHLVITAKRYLVDAWVIDIADQRRITDMLKYVSLGLTLLIIHMQLDGLNRMASRRRN
jgi:tRNA-specific adenosine deaminase 3